MWTQNDDRGHPNWSGPGGFTSCVWSYLTITVAVATVCAEIAPTAPTTRFGLRYKGDVEKFAVKVISLPPRIVAQPPSE